ncbi:hypothetical protein CRG98_021349, partial [Punica granatum]
MKVIKASKYKVVEQMGKSPAHISLLALLLSSEPDHDAILKVLTVAQVLKETTLDKIEETVNSIFSNQISFADDEIPSEGQAHLRALHIMNVDMSRVRASKTTVRAFDGSRRVVNGEIDLLIDVGPCSFSVTFQILEIPNAFSLLLGRPWIHAAGAIPSSLHQKLKFFVEGKLITINGEEDYAIYKETAVPYINIGEDQNLPFYSFDTVSVIRHYREVDPSQADRMIGKARRGKHLHRIATHYGKVSRGIPVPPLSQFFPAPPVVMGGTSDSPITESDDFSSDAVEALALPAIYAVTEETSFRVHICPVWEDEELANWTTVPLYSAMVVDVSPPKRQHLRRQRADLLLYIKEEVIKQMDAGFLEVCNYSEWVANIVPMEKKNGKVRVCIDYQDLNRASPKDNFPLPHIDVLVDNIACHTQFSFMDDFSGYNQIQMAEEDKIKMTFITMRGTFCYKVMPFGLKNARGTYQRAMVTLFHDVMHKEIEYKLRLNSAKYTFGVKSGKLLGFVVSEKGIEVDPDKVKAIMELPPPSTMHEVRSSLGLLNYIAHFIANLTDKCQPLFRLLCKNAAVKWDDECQKAFDTVKAYLVQPPVLVPPSPDRPLILYLIVRRQSIGCMLGQKDDSSHVTQRLRQYTLYHTVRLLSKSDPLKYLLDSPSSMRNIAKWRCQLTKYDIEYVSCTSVKGQAITNYLAEFPIDDDTLFNSDFPDEGILQVNDEEEDLGWKVYFDGAVNSTGSGIGAVLISPEGRHFPVAAKINFPCTNNIAEYEACILGLQIAIDLKVKELEVFGDLMLTIFQTLKQWKTKDPKLVSYHEYLEELTKNFDNVSFTYTPRTKNQFADALATLASMVCITSQNLLEPIEFEITMGLAHCDMIEAVDSKPCETLYRRSFDAALRCVDGNEAQRLIEEVHEGNCGPHMNGLMLAKKLMRLGYFWSTMEIDCVMHVRHCHLCQVYVNHIKAPPNELHPMVAPWPFSMWGMDVIGLINPKASNGHLFILVAIDYFTKWIEAITLAS